MSFLLKKAKGNKNASFFLIERNFHASSVHCAYYSCFQLISYVLKDYFTEEYEDVLKMWKDGKPLHNEMVKTFHALYSGIDREGTRDVRRKILELREFRVESDYYDIDVNS